MFKKNRVKICPFKQIRENFIKGMPAIYKSQFYFVSFSDKQKKIDLVLHKV
jgi:hypothetical protein